MANSFSRRPWLPIALVFSFLLADFLHFKTFVYADDVKSLQQDVILAKQKMNELNGKSDAVSAYLDANQSEQLKKEAEALMAELAASEKTAEQPAIKVSDAKPVEKPIKVPVSRSDNLPRKVILKKQPVWPWKYHESYKYNDVPLPEGAISYKVAISDGKITLKECEEIGIVSNIKLQAMKKKIEAAEAKLTEAKRALYPTVQYVHEDVSGHAGTFKRFYKGHSDKINLNQPLFYGGELKLTVKQAEENVKSAKAEYNKEKGDYIHTIRNAYYQLVKAEYNVQYQEELNKKVSELYEKFKQAHEEKVMPEIDYLNVESQYHQVYFQTESSKNDRLSADMVLHQTLSLDGGESLPLDLKLEFKKMTPNYDEVLQQALTYNEEVRIKQAALQSAEYGIKIFKAKKMPRIDLRGSYGLLGEQFQDTKSKDPTFVDPGGTNSGIGNYTGNERDVDTEKEWFLGVHGSMPLGPNSVEVDHSKHVYGPTVLALTGSDDEKTQYKFNLFDKLSDITDEKQAQAAFLQAESDLEKAKNDATLKIRDEFYNMQKSLIQIDSSIARIRYQDKQNTILEYLLGVQETAPANYLEGLIENAQNKYSFIQAVADYHVAVSALSVAIGDPDYFETQ